jgi:hypothetical protein
MALSDSWTGQIAGRLVAGAGGVLLNVQMTKMVADWFAGREIATAERRGAAEYRRARIGVRPAGRASLEPARARSAAANAGDRHGRVLHRLLCHVMLGPAAGGACAKWAGSAAAAFDFGAAMIVICPVILWTFNRLPAALPKGA